MIIAGCQDLLDMGVKKVLNKYFKQFDSDTGSGHGLYSFTNVTPRVL